MAVDRSEIVFFDLETIPLRGGQKWTIIEFGAILLCPQKLVEIDGHLGKLFWAWKSTTQKLADVRMNIEILKSCATVLFLESSSPNVLPAPNLATPAISSSNINPRKRKAFTETDSEENPENFVEPNEISTFSREILEDQNLVILKDPSTFSLKIVSSQWATPKMTLFHEDLPFPMHYSNMKIRYGISKKYYHPTGKQRLSFVVEPSAETCNILKIYDVLVHILFKGHNDMSKWKPLVKDDQNAIPNIRIHIETSGFGNTATYSTELYVTDSHGTPQRFAAMAVDIDELDELFVSGKLVDADFNFEIYDFEQKAGIRLVARRLTVCGDG